jgi:hypothetical protein
MAKTSKQVTKLVRAYMEKLKPGWHFRSREMSDALFLEGKERHAASAVLWNEAKQGRLEKKKKVSETSNENLWMKPLSTVKDPVSMEEVEEEEKFVCHECRKSFSGTELGESILRIIYKHAHQWKGATSRFKEMSNDHRMLVDESKELKQLILEKDKLILSLNRKLSEGTKQVDLHSLNKKFEGLPKNVGKGDSRFAQT